MLIFYYAHITVQLIEKSPHLKSQEPNLPVDIDLLGQKGMSLFFSVIAHGQLAASPKPISACV